MPDIGLLLASLGRAGRDFQQDRRKRRLEDEVRAEHVSDRQRKQRLEDMLAGRATEAYQHGLARRPVTEGRTDEEYGYKKTQRPLEEALKRSEITKNEQSGDRYTFPTG